MKIKVAEAALRSFSENVLQKVGLSSEYAFTVTDSLLFANLRGIDSHGIIRLLPYVRRLEVGGTKAAPDIKIVREKPNAVLVDGDNGMGQVVSMAATELAICKAKESGASFVGVKGSAHNGAASYYAVEITEAGMIGISMSNTTPVMAAWGGAESVIGNNPLSIAVPFRKRQPIVFDAAMSKVAGGKVRLAAASEKKIPKGWILDKEGRPTEDPNDFLEGTLLPFGEHKGFGLAIMIEILSAVVTGADMLQQNPFWAAQLQTPLNIGHSFIAIDIASFMESRLFEERLEWMVKTIKSSPPAEESNEVLLPGEKEARVEEERLESGIPVAEEVWEDLEQLAVTYEESLQHLSLSN